MGKGLEKRGSVDKGMSGGGGQRVEKKDRSRAGSHNDRKKDSDHRNQK